MHISFREANATDADRLLAWRNDPLTVAMSRTSETVSRDAHIAWLAARLSRAEPNLYIVEVSGRAAGTFRVDGEEISYTLAPEWRGQGLATPMLALIHEHFGPLRAEVYRRNVASEKAARCAGHAIVYLD